jgi:hypothetical protein
VTFEHAVDGISDWCEEGCGSGEVAYVEGVPYIAAWRRARRTADRVNGELGRLGLQGLQAVPRSDPDGRVVVSLRGSESAMLDAVVLLRRGAGAPPRRDKHPVARRVLARVRARARRCRRRP